MNLQYILKQNLRTRVINYSHVTNLNMFLKKIYYLNLFCSLISHLNPIENVYKSKKLIVIIARDLTKKSTILCVTKLSRQPTGYFS